MENLVVVFWVMYATYNLTSDTDRDRPFLGFEQDIFISETECEKAKEAQVAARNKEYKNYKVECVRLYLPYSKFKQIKIDNQVQERG